MIWINGETWQTKKERLSNWHRWFAWHPVTVGESDGRHIKAWLQWVERKGTVWLSPYDGAKWNWEYRIKEDDNGKGDHLGR